MGYTEMSSDMLSGIRRDLVQRNARTVKMDWSMYDKGEVQEMFLSQRKELSEVDDILLKRKCKKCGLIWDTKSERLACAKGDVEEIKRNKFFREWDKADKKLGLTKRY